MTRVNKILVFIPVLFIILRVWATVQYFFSVYASYHAVNNGRCIPEGLEVVHVVLGVLQVRGIKLVRTHNGKGFGRVCTVTTEHKSM